MDNPELFAPSSFDPVAGMDYRTDVTLRDLFAGMAMQGMLAATERGSKWPGPVEVAERSYEAADAMLKERSKSGAR